MREAFEMGLVGGQRAVTPLAAVSVSLARGELKGDERLFAILGSPLIAAATVHVAAAELAGDKQHAAPDRIGFAGLAARFVTSALAGAVLTPANRALGALVGGLTAAAAAFPGWAARVRAARRWGQTATGIVEDAAVVAAAVAIVRRASLTNAAKATLANPGKRNQSSRPL